MIARTPFLLRLLVFAFTYAVLAKLILTFFANTSSITVAWIPGGLAFAFLIRGSLNYWPGVFVGALAAGLMVGHGMALAIAIAVGNTLEPLLGAYALRRLAKFDQNLLQPRDFLMLVLIGCLSAFASATIGPTALLWADILSPNNLFSSMVQWWQGDAFGIIMFTPALLVWKKIPMHWFAKKRCCETVFWIGLSFLFGQIIFLDWFANYFSFINDGYWMFLFVSWGAVKFGTRGALLNITMILIQGLMSASLHIGYFATTIPDHPLASFWLYMITLTFVGILVALVNKERDRAQTFLRKNEKELQRAKSDAEKANRAKSTFLSHMSHELRTPLNAIIGFSDLLLSDELRQDQHMYVEKIAQGGKHLLAVINEILDQAAVESGTIAVNLKVVAVKPLITDCIALMQPLALESQLTIVNTITKDFYAIADPLHLKKIIINLISNAIKYNRPNGSVTLSCQSTDVVKLAIADTGIGLNTDQLEHLFTPFDRLEHQGSRIEGTGIGLSICKQLAAALNGTIAVSSTRGQGSIFSLTIPLANKRDPS